ncbi:MAG: 2-oxoacid ferredoxin oxidoreductase [Spirochaetes bacterium GWF1_51_8]|nr:MAG: 2-oxoacid ferredoxin oxidoreductase [Spirochaetes bacterium GWF1_51_8]
MNPYDLPGIDIAWCPGCGNFSILKTVKDTLAGLDIPQNQVVYVSGIGQAAKIPQYVNASYFNGLHGRALPVATAIKMSNPGLTVIAEGGDGDMYGEGGNHFIHTIRRNPDIAHFVHNNMVYGLTKGQASPTTPVGMKTPVQINGVTNEPFNPIAVALALDAPFIARAYSADIAQLKDILRQAILFKGYALVDILHPCVTFNKLNTYQWYKENTYYLDSSHDPSDRQKAFGIAVAGGKLALGVIYRHEGKPTLTDNLHVYRETRDPLYLRKPDRKKLGEIIRSKSE